MKVKLDEPLAESPKAVVTSHGHIASTVRDQGWGGLKEAKLWPLVQAEGAFFVTTDRVAQFRSLLSQVLKRHRLETLAGTVTVASAARLRIRRKPT